MNAQVKVVLQDLNCSGGNSECRRVQEYLLQTVRSDSRMQISGQSEIQAIQTEIELQKDEDFLEGSSVDALLSTEVDWRISATYRNRSRTLTVSIYDANTQQLIDQESTQIELGFMGVVSDREDELKEGIQRLFARQFQQAIYVLKALRGSSNKAREVLVAGGTEQALFPTQVLYIRTENADLTAGAVVGRLLVELVESKNFSRCSVTKGGKAIQTALNSGQRLLVTLN